MTWKEGTGHEVPIRPEFREEIMNRAGSLTLTTMALLLLGVSFPSGDAVGQEKTLKEQTRRNLDVCFGRYGPPGWQPGADVRPQSAGSREL